MDRKKLTKVLLAKIKTSIKERYCTDNVKYTKAAKRGDTTNVNYEVNGKAYYYSFSMKDHTTENYKTISGNILSVIFEQLDKDLR